MRWLHSFIIYSLGFFLFCSATTLRAQTCEANFNFGYIDPNTVVFYNISTDYDAVEWDFGSGVVVGEGAGAIIVEFVNIENTICLTVFNSTTGCEDDICQTIYEGHDNEICNITDCVWPGDSDGDRKANMYDLLNIGVGFGIDGPHREHFPDADNPNFWAPNFSTDWMDDVQLVNFKHLDCDGNGVIDENDIHAIHQNYTPDFNYTSTPVEGAPPLYVEFEESTIIVDSDSTEAVEIIASIYIGSEDTPVTDLYGLAFDLIYRHDLVAPNSTEVTYFGDSFFGPAEEVLEVKEDLYNLNVGRFDLAFSRKNQEGASGYGKLAEIKFVIISDIIEILTAPEVTFAVELERVKMNNPEGEKIDYGNVDLNNSMDIIFASGTISSTEEPALDNKVQLFPNPAKNQVTLNLDPSLQRSTITLFNQFGQPVQQRSVRGNGNIHQIKLDQLPAGIYLVEVQSSLGRIHKKLIIE